MQKIRERINTCLNWGNCSFLFFCGLAFSCQPNDGPKDLIAEDKMIDIMTELQVAESRVGRLNLRTYDSSVVAFQYLQDKVFEKYKVDSTQYIESYDYYGEHPKQFADIFERVEDKIKDMEVEASDGKIIRMDK
ncbi:DUF4296 domain-containing protein [Marinilongibacter aquaticus]|uniref:DUF4296 domain-containing protein n=1 Tax=Marinilongibacter aquaticus TaxID=2975157 RepID=UPI0021BD97C2|nr:DUF4296 domain-containing protein [Marinilongibacter aquaticus]UBM57572.1 DUF4296 domain-containing protein [Marinilongibacter aquaticus]